MARSGMDLYISNMREPADAIRTYSLFGESAELPDVLHCETIAARSALHDWELAPHRHARLHQLLLLRAGGGRAHLEGRDVALAPPALVNVPVGDVHAFAFEPGTDGWVLTFAAELLDQLVAGGSAERRVLGRSAVLPADTAVVALAAQIAAEHDGRAPARALLLRGLSATLLALTLRRLSQQEPARRDAAGSRLLQRFEALIDAHHAQQHSVAAYARALAVSPTHLSRVVRTATGAPASRLIEARLMREARRLLAYTNLQVTTIAYTLGFADPAYFSRAFARAEGLPPREFRARLDRASAAGR